MRSRLLAACIALALGAAATLPAADLVIDSGSFRTVYRVAEDEVRVVPRAGQGPRFERVREAVARRLGPAQAELRLSAAAPNARGYAARAREVERLTGGEAWAVLRQAGQRPGDEPTLLTRWVMLRLQPGVHIADAIAGLPLQVVRREPWAVHGTLWVCRATADDPLAAVQAAELARRRPGVAAAEPVLRQPLQRRGDITANDQLLSQQKHLFAGGAGGINAVGAWDYRSPRLTGKGVVININDDGIDAEHPDLLPNLLLNAGFSYRENQPQSVLATDYEYTDQAGITRTQNDNHGTVCAGLAAARGNNGIGVAGVAYEASIVDVQHLGVPTSGNAPYEGDLLAAALTHNLEAADAAIRPWITSNAYGVPKFRWIAMPDAVRQAFEAGTRARDGRGVVHIFAIGNERREYEVQNMNAIVNNEYVIAVGATDWLSRQAPYSNMSASLFVCAPGGIIDNQNVDRALVSTDRSQDGTGYHQQLPYTYSRGKDGEPAGPPIFDPVAQTSFAAAITSGVVALMFDANPKLTYRDVMHILARHSEWIDSNDNGADEIQDPNAPYGDLGDFDKWVVNGARVLDGAAAEVRYSNRYGFGRVHALQAVAAASQWHPVSRKVIYETEVQTVNQPIPEPSALAIVRDFDPTKPAEHVATTITVTSDLVPPRFRIERVVAVVDLEHERGGDLSLYLRSPAGTWAAIGQRNIRPAADGIFDLTLGDIKLSEIQRGGLIQILIEELYDRILPNPDPREEEISYTNPSFSEARREVLKKLSDAKKENQITGFIEEVNKLGDKQILDLIMILLRRGYADWADVEDVIPAEQVHGLVAKHNGDNNYVRQWEFVFNAFWGESPIAASGAWTLYVNDHLAWDTGVVKSWKLRFIGYHESETPTITLVKDERSPDDDTQQPVIVNEDHDTVLTIFGTGFVENDAGDPLTAFSINRVNPDGSIDNTAWQPLDAKYIEIISETEARITIPADIDLAATALAFRAENYSFVSQFTGDKTRLQDPTKLLGAAWAFPIVHNRPPRLHVSGTYTVIENQPLRDRLLGTDEDQDPFIFEIMSQPAHGRVELLDPQRGIFLYTPDANYWGTDSFTARVVDRHGATSPVGTITVRIIPSSQVPDGGVAPPGGEDQYGKGGTSGGCLAGSGLLALIAGLGLVLLRMPSLRRRG